MHSQRCGEVDRSRRFAYATLLVGDHDDAGLLGPWQALAGAAQSLYRLLGSTTMVTLGRWSYGLFIWHLAALAMVFPVIGEFAFNGHMPVVLVLTVVFGFAIAAVSYALVESPCRVALRRWEFREQRPVPPLDSAVRNVPEPVAR